MTGKNRIRMGITMGDPSGIGPEVIIKSFENPDVRSKRIIVIGDYNIMKAMYNLLKIRSFNLHRISNLNESQFDERLLNILDLRLIDMKKFKPGEVRNDSGNAAFMAIKKAVELVMNKEIDAIVTAPVNKEALHLAGHKYPGHTEILAGLTNTKDYAMLLYDKRLRVIHVSTHISLLEAITGLKRERIEKVIEMAHEVMRKLNVEV